MSYFLTRSPESLEMQRILRYNEKQAVCHWAMLTHHGLQHIIPTSGFSCHQAFTLGAVSIPHSFDDNDQQSEAIPSQAGGVRHLEPWMARAQILLDTNLQLE